MVNVNSNFPFTITYLLICFIISIPFNYANYQLIYPSDGIPAGSDSSFHVFAVLKILQTKNALISFSQYPSHLVTEDHPIYYPSLLHLLLAIFASIAGLGQPVDYHLVLDITKSFMYLASLAGTAGFALLIKSLLFTLISKRTGGKSDSTISYVRYWLLILILSVVAFSFFIFSVSRITQTYNDGAYPQLFAMWAIFPFHLYLLINRHWISSGILLAIIASSHYVAVLVTLSATIPFLISLLLQRGKNLKNGLLKFSLAFIACAIPALIFFYIPVATGLAAWITNSEGLPSTLVGSWSLERAIQLITPNLYYAGIICALLLLTLNYRVAGWLFAWVTIHFIAFNVASEIGARFARDLSVVFGVVIGVCIGYILFALILFGKKSLDFRTVKSINEVKVSSTRLISTVIISAGIVSLWYFSSDELDWTVDPDTVKFFSSAIDDANNFVLSTMREKDNSDAKRGVIVLFGQNPWLKVTTFGKLDVLPAHPPSAGSATDPGDRGINSELSQIFLSPTLESTACVLENYDVDFLYLSDMLPGRYYEPDIIMHYRQLKSFQSVVHSPYFELEREFLGEGKEHIKVFSVNKDKVSTVCGSR